MRQTWLVGSLAGVILAANAAAQTQPQAKPATDKPAGTTTQKPADPATAKPATTTRQRASTTPGQVPTGEMVLGTVTIPRTVTADGKTLASGRYTIRLTAQAAQPTVAGQLPDLNRWVEFVRGGTVSGREVVSIIPADEVDDTQQGPDLEVTRRHVPRGGQRVEMLKGGDYLRVWINRGGFDYLVHLPPAGGAAR